MPREQNIFNFLYFWDSLVYVCKVLKNSHLFPKRINFLQDNQTEEDPAKLSRLFYLQLYSSVLNSDQDFTNIKTSEEKSVKKFTFPKTLSDWTNTLLKKKEALKRTLSEDFERDTAESIHETVIGRVHCIQSGRNIT